MSGSPSPQPGLSARLAWFAAIYAVSVAALGLIAWAIRAAIA